jgi:hypothetical protein
MATVPTVPSFTFEETPTTGILNQLASCVTWLNTLPAYALLEETSTTSVAASTFTALPWPTKITDRDSGWSSGSNTMYTAQTPGYYAVSAGIAFAVNGNGSRIGYFQVTTGSNNPGGAGNTTIFGTTANSPANASTVDCVLALGTTSPYLYVGDYLQVFAYQSTSGALNSGPNRWTVALISLGP